MDPKSCYNEMVEHYLNDEIEEAKDKAEDLLHWFSIGGFIPWVTGRNYAMNCVEVVHLTNLISELNPQQAS